MEKPAPRRYEGDFVVWNGGCLLIGMTGADGGVIAPHSHYAIHLAIGAPEGLRVQFGRNAPWQSYAAALVPSRATHTIDVAGSQWTAVLFIEPETPQGRALGARLQGRLELLDEAPELAGCLTPPAVAQHEAQHVPVHPHVFARHGLAEHVGSLQVLERSGEVAEGFGAGGGLEFLLHGGTDAAGIGGHERAPGFGLAKTRILGGRPVFHLNEGANLAALSFKCM